MTKKTPFLVILSAAEGHQSRFTALSEVACPELVEGSAVERVYHKKAPFFALLREMISSFQ